MKPRNPSPLGEAIIAERHRTGETQEAFGEKVGLAGGTIARIERGEVREIKTGALRRISITTELSAEYLLGMERGQANYRAPGFMPGEAWDGYQGDFGTLMRETK